MRLLKSVFVVLQWACALFASLIISVLLQSVWAAPKPDQEIAARLEQVQAPRSSSSSLSNF